MPNAESIVSAANPLLKDVRRAIARGGLTREGLAVAETFHLLEEALRSDCEVPIVLAAESVQSAAESHVRRAPNVRLAILPDDLFQSLAGTETTQGVMALVRPPTWTIEHLLRRYALVVVLDGLQDPGNAGTIVRAAEAFGATGVLFLKGSVNPHNPKTLRASAGSLFRMPYLAAMDVAVARAALAEHHVALYAGVPARPDGGTRSVTETDLTVACGLAIGNEAHGVSGELRSAAVEVSIPTVGVESLNAAVAAGILLYEARRQRAMRT
jgi:RNA methyltransferase, TrmH family